jgi:hypothetical protein
MRGLIIIGCLALAAAFASCTQPVTAPISQQPVGDIDAYFWWNGEASMSFVDTTDIPIGLPLTFMNDANGLLEVSDGVPPNIKCIVNEDSVYAFGFTSGSVFNLPKDSYFSALDTDTFFYQPPSAIVTTDDSPFQTVVATDSGIYFYDQTLSSFFQLSLDSSDVTALAIDSTSHRVYAATALGFLVYANTPLSSTSKWLSYSNSGLPPGSISQLLWLRGDSLFAAVAGVNGIYVSNGGSWIHLQFLSTNPISTLGKFQTSTALYLLAATNGQIAAHSLDAIQPDAPLTSIAGAGTIRCFGGQTGSAFAGAESGLYEWSGPSTNTWTLAPTLKAYPKVTSLAVNATQIIFLSNGSVYTDTIGNSTVHQVPVPTSANPALQVGWNSSNAWVLTAHYYVISSGSGYDAISGLPNGYWPHDTGGLVLLRNTLFANDSSWRAGTLVKSASDSSFSITARVLAHLDSLHVSANVSGKDSTQSFSDDLVVRYSHELPGEMPEPDLPYWIVYYAKNKGPVMFDNVPASGTGAKLRRYEVSPKD